MAHGPIQKLSTEALILVAQMCENKMQRRTEMVEMLIRMEALEGHVRQAGANT
jgi:hypothetical protein